MTQAPVITRRAAICSLVSSLGLLLIAVAILIPILQGGFTQSSVFKYIFAAGALIALLAALFNRSTATELRERRWHRIESWSAIFFAAAAAMMFIPNTAPRDWLAFTLAGAAIRIICFIRGLIPTKKQIKK